MEDTTKILTIQYRGRIFKKENLESLKNNLGSADFCSLQNLCTYVIIENIHKNSGKLEEIGKKVKTLRVLGNNETDFEIINKLKIPKHIKYNIMNVRFQINELLTENDLKEFGMPDKIFSLLENFEGNNTLTFSEKFTIYHTKYTENWCFLKHNYCDNCRYCLKTFFNCHHFYIDYTEHLRVGFNCQKCFKEFIHYCNKLPHLLNE